MFFVLEYSILYGIRITTDSTTVNELLLIQLLIQLM